MPFISMVVGGVAMFLSLMLLLPPSLLLPDDLEETDDDALATALKGRFLFVVLNMILLTTSARTYSRSTRRRLRIIDIML